MKKNKALRKSDLLYHIIKGWRMIVLFTLIGILSGLILIGASYIRGEVARQYKITSSSAVVTALQTEDARNSVTASRVLTDTVIYIIKSQKNMEAVVDDLGLRGVTASDIARNLRVSRYGDTEVVEMTLLWRSEKEGLQIMDSINRMSTKSIKDIIKIGATTVINEPKASFIPGGNISMSTWIYAAIFGLVLGVGFCILRFLIAPTLINESDVTNIFGIDTLGSMPLEKDYVRAKPTEKNDLPIMEDIKSTAHLLISHMETARAHKLYITSTVHNEGKTRLLADIAMQLARLGKKTLLVDCDLANPQLGALFFTDLKYEQTLNALYRGDADKLDAILHVNGCLDLLPTVLERNPEDINDPLLGVLKTVTDGYDYVLIDAAPIGVDAEVLRLNEVVDTVLYVVRYDYAKLDDIKRAMLRIAKSGIPVVGAAFNCVINWRQTIINAPKRLSASLKREQKRREKEEKRHAEYEEKRLKRAEMEKRPDRRYLDGIAPKEPDQKKPEEVKAENSGDKKQKKPEKKKENKKNESKKEESKKDKGKKKKK